MSGLSRTPGKRVYGESRTAGSNPALSANVLPAIGPDRIGRLLTMRRRVYSDLTENFGYAPRSQAVSQSCNSKLNSRAFSCLVPVLPHAMENKS